MKRFFAFLSTKIFLSLLLNLFLLGHCCLADDTVSPDTPVVEQQPSVIDESEDNLEVDLGDGAGTIVDTTLKEEANSADGDDVIGDVDGALPLDDSEDGAENK